MSANLLTTHFRSTLRQREERIRQGLGLDELTDDCDNLNYLLKFTSAFLQKYLDTATYHAHAPDLADSPVARIRTPDDFITTLGNAKLESLERFLNDFVSYQVFPVEMAVKKDDLRTIVDRLKDAKISARSRLLAEFKKDPATTLINKDKSGIVIGTIVAMCFFYLASIYKTEYDVALTEKNESVWPLMYLSFDFAIGLFAAADVLRLAYNWHKHSQTRGPAASNENFLQWLDTSSRAVIRERPILMR